MHTHTKQLKKEYRLTAYHQVFKTAHVPLYDANGAIRTDKKGEPLTVAITVQRCGKRRATAPSLREFASRHPLGAAWLRRKSRP